MRRRFQRRRRFFARRFLGALMLKQLDGISHRAGRLLPRLGGRRIMLVHVGVQSRRGRMISIERREVGRARRVFAGRLRLGGRLGMPLCVDGVACLLRVIRRRRLVQRARFSAEFLFLYGVGFPIRERIFAILKTLVSWFSV